MLKMRWVLTLMVLGLLGWGQSWAETAGTPPQSMISANDHNGLAIYYTQQAQELKEKAKSWEFTAEFYEKHEDPKTKAESAKHAAHCRAIAQNYKKAAAEAEALVTEHRAMLPHGKMQ